ncbi:MAG: hypothetical protein J7J20_01460 [Desulfurococcales archaeon]|nr:hypothetical protein [Desulfurococcales archaeon]
MENKGSDSSKLIRSYLRVLLLNFYRFFSKDCVLNSDGRKLLNDIAREVAKCEPHLMELVKKVRKNPTLENILKLTKEFLSEDEISEVIDLGVYGSVSSYKYRACEKC